MNQDHFNRCNRRQLCAAGISLVTASHLAGSAFSRDLADTAIVDTHLHCFSGNTDPRFPYHPRAPYRPEEAATPQWLLKCMRRASVHGAVVVHPEPYQDDHRYLEYCLAQDRKRLRGTCLFFADRAGSVEKMAGLAERTRGQLIAARLHAYAPDRLPPFGTPELANYWKMATDLGLAMQLHFEPRYAPGLEPYITQFPQTTVIIDHLGRPMQGTKEEHDVVVRWARFPNTVMKVSSLPSQDRYPHRPLQPIVKDLTRAFGAERMIYGGGFNKDATGKSYKAYHQRVLELLSHLPSADQQKILGRNAIQLYRLNDQKITAAG
ncbi:MAG: amidohydrolase family protein [Planctomycetota bacterium]|nr:amidohydrolase family protein [Planctomycetota bacterium]